MQVAMRGYTFVVVCSDLLVSVAFYDFFFNRVIVPHYHLGSGYI